MKNKANLTDIRVILILAGICCFLWGSATPAIKIGYQLFGIKAEDISSILLFAGARFFLAGLLVILWHSFTSRTWILPQKGSGTAILQLALTQTILQYIFFYVGLSYSSGVHGAIITGTSVFFSILFAGLIFHYETLNMRKMLGCGLGFAGIVIVNLSGQGAEGLFDMSFRGEGCVLLAQMFYAVSSGLVKKYARQYDVVTLSGYQFFFGGLVLMVIGAVSGGSLNAAAGPSAFLLLLYMGFLSAVAYTVWGILLQYNPVSRVTIFGFMNPVFGVLLSAFLLGEANQALSWNTLAALVLVSLGIYVVNGEKSPKD